jgi:hypothetical protein
MSPILTVSSTDMTALLAHVSTLVSDVGVVIWFAIGLPLGFWLIRKTISLVKAR